MKSTHPRMYHPFPTIRTAEHLLPTAGLLLVPLLSFFAFSVYTGSSAPEIFANLSISLFRMFVALLISVVLGWTFAVLIYNSRVQKIAFPLFDVLQSLPATALLPMAVLYFGRTNTTVIFFLVLAIVWAILFSIVSSLKLIKREWIEAVHVSRIKGVDYLKLFLIPASIPGLVTGTIIGAGAGWEALVATELILQMPNGLGAFFSAFSTNTSATTFGILAMLTIIFAINKLVWLPLLDWSHRLVEE